jgi:hypothetical protein
MRNLWGLGSIGLLILALAVLAPSVQAEKKVNTEDQVAVLMKWYRAYFDEGKYKQAEQVAQLAYDLAPDDPQIAVALKLVRRQQATIAANVELEAQLARVLQKLDRMERQLRTTAVKNRQRTILQISQEPPGSPDGPIK